MLKWILQASDTYIKLIIVRRSGRFSGVFGDMSQNCYI